MIKQIKAFFKEESPSPIKAGFYYFLCQMLVSGLSFLSTPIFTRLMDKAAYGAFSNFAAWETVLIPIVTLNLRTTIAKSKYDFREKNDTYLSSVLAISSIVTFAMYLVIEWNSVYFETFFGMEMHYIRILFFYLILSPAFLYQQIQYRMYNRYRLFVLYATLSAILRMGISVVLVLILDDKFAGRVYGYVIPAMLIYFIIYIHIWVRGRKVDLDCCKYALKMAIPLIPSALSASLLNSSDQIMLTNMSGSRQTALYSIAYSVSSIAGVAWNALNQAWGPWFYDKLDAEKFDDIRSGVKKFQYGYILLIAGLMLIVPELVLIMGGKSYYEAIWVMPPVILAMVCQFYYSFYFNVEYFYGKTFLISFGTLLAAAVNLGLNFLFIPKWGYIAAAYTTLVGYLCMLIYHYIIVKFVVKKAFIYDNKLFFRTLLLATLFQIIVAFLYNYPIVRYALIAIYAVLFIWYVWTHRKMLLSKIKGK